MGAIARLRRRYRELETFHATTGIPLPYWAFVASVFVAAVIVAHASTSLIPLLPPIFQANATIVSAALFVGVASLILSVPIASRASRISAIEESLPDALKYMAVVLRAGGTIESALEEVSKAGYGPISADLALAFKGMREGRSFEDVLSDVAAMSGSKLFARCISVIVDARRAGASLADVMDSIGDDAREVLRLRRERAARTAMHTFFIAFASLALAPFIFGFVFGISDFFTKAMAGALAAVPLPITALAIDFDALLTTFIVIQVVLGAFAMGAVSQGKMLRYVLQIPFMALIALSIYIVGKWLSTTLIGG